MRVSPPGFHAAIFFLAVFYRVTHDELTEISLLDGYLLTDCGRCRGRKSLVVVLEREKVGRTGKTMQGWQASINGLEPLRTVPTFVSAHTFCASCKPWFKRARALGLTLTSTTPPRTRLKLKQNFPTVTKSINEPVLKPGRPE